MSLRTATGRDAAALAGLEAAAFGADAWSEAALVGELEGPGRHALVAIDRDEVVGYAVILRQGDLVDLQRILVRPDRRRRGLARSLLEAVLADATAAGADAVLLEVSAANSAALAFYDAAGFAEVARRRRYYRDGTDAVVMRRPSAADDGGGG